MTDKNFGGEIAGMLKRAVRGEQLLHEREKEHRPNLPKVGDKITLTKLSLKEGQQSAVRAGEAKGVLVNQLALDEPVFWGSGNTSPVKAMRIDGDNIIIETATSVYRIAKAS